MEGIKITALAFMLCGFYLYTVQCESCMRESNAVGKIVGGGYIRGYTKCWTITVPPGHFIHIQIISMTSEKRSCDEDRVIIKIEGSSDEHKLCNAGSYKNPVTALGDVTVTHRVDYASTNWFTSFTLEYVAMPMECLYGNSFRCDVTSCVSNEKVCNGVKDCRDGTDEIGCETIDCMNNNTFKCDTNLCIPEEKVCDGVKHCRNGADEVDCDTLQSRCEKISQASGQIVVAGKFKSKEECWTIPVKLGEFARLHFNALLSKHSCEDDYVSIKIAGRTYVYKFCHSDHYINSVEAFGNVTVIHHVSAEDSKYSSFDLKYTINRLEIDECVDIDSFKCDNSSCIPREKVCDGVKDCKNGADEIGCETGIVPIEGVSEARKQAVSWLKKERTAAWGWRENTPRAVVALYLASDANFNGTNLEEELMAKQNELKTAVSLLRPSLTNNELSMFIHALLVTCHNPRQFYGKNLLKRLKDQVEESGNFTHPLTYLTLCNGNESWPLKATSDLNSVLSSDFDYPFMKDLQAMAVTALSCAMNRSRYINDSLIYDTEKLYKDTIQHFKKIQARDGSFGNAYTTALIAQALLSSGQRNHKDWNFNASVKYLMQELNSSSIDFLAVYFSLPILNGKSLMDISSINCSANPRKHGDDSVSEITDYLGPKIRVHYSLYIGDEKDVIYTTSFRVPKNYSAAEVMQLAADADSKYKFEFKMTSGKMYVYEIAKVKNDPEAGKFWLVYVRTSSYSERLTHFTKGPNEVIMQDNQHLVLWYKTVTI